MGYRVLISICALSAALAAQTPNGQPAFEVASIRPGARVIESGMRVWRQGGPGTDDPTLYTCENCSLSDLVEQAYDVASYRLTAAGWMNEERFNVSARIANGVTKEQFRLMLQNLLVERFKLEVHRDKKEMQMHQLVVIKGGPRFKESPEGDTKPPGPPTLRPGWMWRPVRKETMEQFAKWLEGYAQGPVVDATGLKARYDFELSWSFESLDDPDSPTLFTALQSQLGLKLESKKGPVEILVIDHSEKVPTGN